jgi:LPS-assembly protein
MTRPLRHIAALILALLAGPVMAQGSDPLPPATLIADNIRFAQGTNSIEASGSVEIFFEGSRLRAAAISYDGNADTVSVQGPLTLIQANGRSVILADFAELSADLRDGVLQGARLVLDRQLQIAATQIDRTDGRYTQAYQAIASSCEVCDNNPTPLWEIRARRIVHDQEDRQLYFENATFRALGVPIAYIPRLRLPDPTLDRASGVLTPTLLASDELGTQLRVPYFFRLGDHADLTVTPWLGTGDTSTMELRYRQAFRRGEIEFNGAISRDDLTNAETRGYLFGFGRFDMDRDFVLDFALQGVSDRGYLTTYGFPDGDLLESFVRLSRASRDEYIEIGASSFVALQEGDDYDTLPTQMVNAQITRRFVPDLIGGIATASLDGGGYYRLSDENGMDGRDVARLTGSLDWRRDTVLPGGILMAVEGAFYADIYNTQQDNAFTETATRVTPFLGVEFRYPLARTSARGVTHLIEPIVQLAWSETRGDAVPVEDSVIVEFDEANLFALDRLPGHDRREQGRRANLGIAYTRTDPLGWSLGVVAGMVLRDTDGGQFTPGSGLDGSRSDFLLATHFSASDSWSVINRALFDERLEFTSNELSLAWRGEDHDVLSSYTWLEADPAEGRDRDMAEWAFDARYGFAPDWQAGVDWRYDFVENAATRAGLAVNYANECVDVEFSLSRRFTTSATVTPATELGLTISLNGFGTTREGRRQDRSCHN